MEITENDSQWADEPITSSAEDTYGRGAFAAMVAAKIGTTNIGAASTVFGLLGPWGSGKTSVVALIAEHLPPHWTVQQFTPWVAADRAALQLEFLSALDAALGGPHAEEKAARARLAKFAAWTEPMLGMVPVVGQALSDTASRVAKQLTDRAPWSIEFHEMADTLVDLGRPVLIVCDDIDRLDAKELLDFLKVVRLLGRFPNVHYLIAYDPETVDDLLDAEGLRGRSTSFMEKIIQHPFELPDLDYAARYDHVSRALHLLMMRDSLHLDEQGASRLGKLVEALSKGLSTPRQISRLQEHLSAITALLSQEVDFLDFSAITYLRLNHRDIYAKMPEWAESLRAGLPTDGPKKPGQRTLEEWDQVITTASAGRSKNGAWDVISYLFPHLGPWFEYREHPQAYSDPEYTERYHTMGVPSNDVSDLVVDRAMHEIANPGTGTVAQKRLAETIDAHHESVARLAIAKARRSRGRLRSSADDLLSVVHFIAARMPPVKDEETDYRKPLSALYDWLSEEVFSTSDTERLPAGKLAEVLGDQRLRGVMLRSSGWQVSGEALETTKPLLNELATSYMAEVEAHTNDLSHIVDLREKLTIILRSEKFDIRETMGQITGRPDLILQLARAMVYRSHLFNGATTREQLGFDGDLWTRILPQPVGDEILSFLPHSPSIEEVDRSDTSEMNIDVFAVSAIHHLNSAQH